MKSVSSIALGEAELKKKKTKKRKKEAAVFVLVIDEGRDT